VEERECITENQRATERTPARAGEEAERHVLLAVALSDHPHSSNFVSPLKTEYSLPTIEILFFILLSSAPIFLHILPSYQLPPCRSHSLASSHFISPTHPSRLPSGPPAGPGPSSAAPPAPPLPRPSSAAPPALPLSRPTSAAPPLLVQAGRGASLCFVSAAEEQGGEGVGILEGSGSTMTTVPPRAAHRRLLVLLAGEGEARRAP
jgi:hypothetical protein